MKAIRHTRRERDAHLRALRAIKHWLWTLLFGHVALKRNDGGALCVTLADRSAQTPPAADDPAITVAALTKALNAVPESRRRFKHLYFLESNLRKKGWRTLAEAPPRVLLKALTQLDALGGVPTDPARVLLRERLAAEVIARHRPPEPVGARERNLSPFFEQTQPAAKLQ